jgi:hypothetical protein
MGETIRTFEYPDAKITIHIPELSQEERSRRMKILMGAAQGLLMDSMRTEGKGINDKNTKKMER